MNIQIKEMRLIFIIEGSSLLRKVEDLRGNLIWECLTKEATEVDLSKEGLDAYEVQMRSLPFWNIVEVERIII